MKPRSAVVVGLREVKKSYGGVTALRGVSLEIREGEVQALIGENGAGKSTLMKVLAGVTAPDGGEVLVGGEPVDLANVADARKKGIGIVFQELSLFPDLDVLSNLFPMEAPRRYGLTSRRVMADLGVPVLREVGLSISPNTRVRELTLAQRQLLEIARALMEKPRILILDEPTSALNSTESQRLFELVDQLRQQEVGIVYISHRLEEVFAISDHITVMRNGAIVKSVPRDETSVLDSVTAMLGRAPKQAERRAARPRAREDADLRFTGVDVKDRLANVDFEATRGEVVGLAGLEGAGPETVFDVLFGMVRPSAGKVLLPDGAGAPRSIASAVSQGIARVPSDRRRHGLMLERSVIDNMAAISSGALGRDGVFLSRSTLRERAEEKCRELSIRVGNLESPAGALSGGNQQKLVLAKWLEADPQIVLLDDPTRGVDVGSKFEMYRLIRDLADQRRIVLFYSTELDEYVDICDRTVLFYRGSIVGMVSAEETSKDRVLEAVSTGSVPA